ncbi:MAG: hypothetical protein LCI00_08765 [Chloroflexi bacterium]|nr:hypothetical protein [Chloroflexota bacterium]
MQIVFATHDIRAEANSFQMMTIKYGEQKAWKIRQRLDEIAAAPNLDDLARLPATKCKCMDEEKSLICVVTLHPFVLVFDMARNFDSRVKAINALWKKVDLVEIMNLDKEAK